jgi:hypothetical protein
VLDDSDIRTKEQLARAMADDSFTQRIFDLACAEERYSVSHLSTSGDAILAAHGLDLSGSLGCMHPDCMRRDLEALFSRTWYYFDQVAVVGPSKRVVQKLISIDSIEMAKQNLASLMEILIYIRTIGAEDFVHFTEKAPACEIHYQQHLSEANLGHIVTDSETVIRDFVENGTIGEVVGHESHFHYRFDHPLLEHTQWGAISSDVRRRSKSLERAVAEAVFATLCGASRLTCAPPKYSARRSVWGLRCTDAWRPQNRRRRVSRWHWICRF